MIYFLSLIRKIQKKNFYHLGIVVWPATSLVFSVCNGADVLIGVEAGPVTVELLSC
jgi:hypothetical protein